MKKFKFLLAGIFACIFSSGALAQSYFSLKDSLRELTVINLGDERLLFRTTQDNKPIEGEHRIITGLHSEYIEAQFANGLYDGKYEHYKNNKLIEKGTYKAGVRNGIFFEYYSDGVVESETPYIDGKVSGMLKSFFISGKPDWVQGYKNGVEDGIMQRWNWETGELLEQGTYKEGVKHGTFFTYYDNGVVESETPYIDGKMNGVHKTFFQNGKPKSIKGYKNGVEDGIEQEWHWETGQLILDAKYVDGQLEGKQIVCISSNSGDYTEVSNYVKGVQTGEFTQTLTNGQMLIQGTYKDGEKDGVWTEYNKNGKPKRSTTYKNGKRNGEDKKFYTDGTVEKIETYVNDEREGITQEFFFDSGKLKAEYNFSDNVKEGRYKMFYEDGSLREEGRYENDSDVYRKEYYKNGQVKQISERNSRGQWETLEKYNEDGTQK